MSEKKYLTITALTKYIKRKFDVDPHMQDVWLKGEISNFKWHSRGHMYFTLKDKNARILAVMFAGNNRNLGFTPEEGMNVLVRGEISVYESSGNYQIYIKEMQPDGIGSLFLAYEELKKKLASEGLFDAQHKKPIPKFPKGIAVITSPTGAAIRDIITTLRRRYPIAKVTVIPALVQGVHAAPSIAKAIATANTLENIDVIIVGRGGGSIEELWAFNEEQVAREIFKSNVPIISAVGHETDFTIADFVADLRAPTPTAAAELAVPHIIELAERLSDRERRLHRSVHNVISGYKERLVRIQKSYAFRYPQNLYVQKEQELDRLMDSLETASKRLLEQKRMKLEQLSALVIRNHPKKQWEIEKNNLERQVKLLQTGMNQSLLKKQWEFQSALSKLEMLSPLNIMKRGYNISYNENGELIKSTTQTEVGKSIQVHVQDGKLDCTVKNIIIDKKMEG
ncbi:MULTISPECIES: exodeoxyribonuclease VII large subunit [Bacillus]|uniref:exodeoxyribonuclease VII large subunit n=1 Tax=Bacillus TaxID=1386 RepID=UPI000BB98194|nr:MULTISPECIES: exodeoxyribonuclease VII large subunit [Bacillus]